MSAIVKTDVIIVGAGPTGLALACQLIRHQVDFVIVDKNSGVTRYSKALGVHARTLEIYEQFGLAEKAVALGTVAGKVRMLEGGEILGEVDLSMMGKGLSAYPYLLVLEQSKNEQLMFDYLQDEGKSVLWETELHSFSQTEEKVIAQVKDASGEFTIEGKFLTGCDGPRSLVRNSLGLSFEGSTFARLFYVADVRIDWNFSHDALHLCLASNGVVAFFPLPGEKRWRIVGAFPEGLEKEEREILYEEIEQRIKEEADLNLDITRVDWFSTYKVHTRHVDRFSSGRCFVAGDSAHIHTPAGGQGMNTGIQDAYNLAWKLALVLKHSANERLLDTYNEERLPNAKRLTATTDRMFNLAAGKDWFVGLIRTTIFPPMAKYILSIESVRMRFFILISQIGINYRDSFLTRSRVGSVKGDKSLNDDEGDKQFLVKAGERMPYFIIDGKSIYDRLREPKFHRLTFIDGQSEISQPGSPDEASVSPLLDHHIVPLYPHIAAIFGTKRPFQLLLRPDNYISFLSHNTSQDLVANYLRELVT